MFMELNFKKSNIWKNMPHGLQVIHKERFDTMTESWSKCVVNKENTLKLSCKVWCVCFQIILNNKHTSYSIILHVFWKPNIFNIRIYLGSVCIKHKDKFLNKNNNLGVLCSKDLLWQENYSNCTCSIQGWDCLKWKENQRLFVYVFLYSNLNTLSRETKNCV